jgi:hypothetical protein
MEQAFAFLPTPTGVSNLLIVRESGTAIRLGVQHVNAWTQCSNGSAIAFTMDGLPIATPASGIIEATGAGTVTFGTGTGATRVCRGYATAITTAGQYAIVVWMWDPVNRVIHISGDVTGTA